MAKAIWNGAVLAQSDSTVMVEGNHYFPISSLNNSYFSENTQTSVCHWKGTANYYDITVDGKVNTAGAWYYAEPLEEAKQIKDHVAFWNGVQVND